ncbi:MAG: MFS transporter [Cloacibacterium sp.]|jgi:MFS family permease|nr:MFS transporter [Cloacibacterium sp.]
MPKISYEAFKILKIQEFRNLILGRLSLVLGFRMTATLIGWWIYDLTKDPFSIGLIGLSEVIPAVSCALYAGYFIDMNEKKRLLLICNFAYVVLLGSLLIPAWFHQDLGLNNKAISYIIYSVIFLTGIFRAFLGPIVPSMIPRIVTKEQLPQAITVNQATFLTASVLGHAIGGFLVALVQIKGALIVIVFLLILASFFFLKVRPQPSDYKDKKVNISESIKEGLDYIFKTKEIVGALTLDLFAVLFGGAVAMIPVFAADILKVGATGYGFLNAATDIGAMLTIITLTFIPLRRNQGKILIFAVAGFGLCILLFGLSRYFLLSFFILVLSGILDGISVVIRGTIVQLKTPDHMRGRVMSVNSIFITSSNELGQFESGVAAKLFGVVPSVVIGGSITMLIAILVGATSPKLWKMQY